MKIYTKTGDNGETSLLGGKRVKKHCLDIEAVGEIDELNTLIGLVISRISGKEFVDVKRKLMDIQHKLFVAGSIVAGLEMNLGEMPRIADNDVLELENWIDKMESDLEPLHSFILPGGGEVAAGAFLARAVCRRAERRVAVLAEKHNELSPLLKQYLNRLSDALFVLARWLNKKNGIKDVVWKK